MLDDDGLMGVNKDLVAVGGVVAIEGQLFVGFDGEVLDDVLFGVDEVVRTNTSGLYILILAVEDEGFFVFF